LSIRAHPHRPAARVMPLLRRGRPRSHPAAAPRLHPANVLCVHLPAFSQAAFVRETSSPENSRGLRRFRTSDLRSGDPPASSALMCGRRAGHGNGRFSGIANRPLMVRGGQVNIKKVYGNRYFPVDTTNTSF
jgi:hypothetical protein